MAQAFRRMVRTPLRALDETCRFGHRYVLRLLMIGQDSFPPAQSSKDLATRFLTLLTICQKWRSQRNSPAGSRCFTMPWCLEPLLSCRDLSNHPDERRRAKANQINCKGRRALYEACSKMTAKWSLPCWKRVQMSHRAISIRRRYRQLHPAITTRFSWRKGYSLIKRHGGASRICVSPSRWDPQKLSRPYWIIESVCRALTSDRVRGKVSTRQRWLLDMKELRACYLVKDVSARQAAVQTSARLNTTEICCL